MAEASVLCKCETELVCARHVARYSRQLGDLPALLAELEVNVARLNRGARAAGGSGKGSAAPLPFDAAAADLAREITGTVTRWAVAVCDPALGVASRPFDQIVMWLSNHQAEVLADRGGPEFVRWLDGAVASARRTILGPQRDRWFAGVCGAEVVRFELAGGVVVPVVGFDVRCEARLFASTQDALVRCRACETVWTVAERREQLVLFAQEFELPLKVITAALPWLAGVGVNPASVRSWTRSRLDRRRSFVVTAAGVARPTRLRRPAQLQPRSVDVDGVALYRVGDVIDLSVETARRSVARLRLVVDTTRLEA